MVNQPQRRVYDKYIWPGGYELFAIMDDGGILCVDCCNDESNPIHDEQDLDNIADAAIMYHERADGWGILAFDHMGNYEGYDENDEWINNTCDHCYREIK